MLIPNRLRTLVLVTGVVCILVLFSRYIYVLVEVAWTYLVFRPQLYIDYDPQTTGGAPLLANLTGPPVVPRILHQIYLDDHGTSESHLFKVEKYAIARAACARLHPSWDMHLWTNANATQFVAEHFPDLVSTYLSYPQTISRTNILRYLLLHHYGGVYLDLDVACLAPLDPLLRLPWLTPGAHPTGINNAFILSKPSHPFLTEQLIPAIKFHNMRWPLPYVDNMLSTGCMFFSIMFTLWQGNDTYVLGGGTRHFLRGHAKTPLFEHFGESSWHGWDAQSFLWIGSHGRLLLGVFVLLALAVVLRGRRARPSSRQELKC